MINCEHGSEPLLEESYTVLVVRRSVWGGSRPLSRYPKMSICTRTVVRVAAGFRNTTMYLYPYIKV